MRSGVPVDEIIACAGMGAGAATGGLLETVTGGGMYQAVQVGPDRLQFARTFRPTWAIALGVVTMPLALLGVLFFLVTTTETCVALVEEDHRGARIRVSGRLDRDVLAALRQRFDDPIAARRDAVAAASVGAPVASAYELPRSAPQPVPAPSPVALRRLHTVSPPPIAPPSVPPKLAPAASPSPGGVWWSDGSVPAQPAPPQGGHLSSAPQPPPIPVIDDRTVVVSGGGGAVPVPTLVLDDGRRLPLATLVLVGRDPAAAPGDVGPLLVAVEDHDRSVSKTHLAIGWDAGAVWLVDRNSTNGCRIIDSSGVEHEVQPGVRVEVPHGASVRFGSRLIRVLAFGSADAVAAAV